MIPASARGLIFAGSVFATLPATFCEELEFPAGQVPELSSESYPNRVAAQKAIQAWADGVRGRAATQILREYEAAEDPETRLRLRELLREAVVSEFQRREGAGGYVGIKMLHARVAIPGQKDPGGGVTVSWIHPGTPAERAGLQVGDVVIGMADIRWPANGDAPKGFSAEVRKRNPGDRVVLEVLRAGELTSVELTLAARPLSLDQYNASGLGRAVEQGASSTDLEAAEQQAKDDLLERWLEERKEAANDR